MEYWLKRLVNFYDRVRYYYPGTRNISRSPVIVSCNYSERISLSLRRISNVVKDAQSVRFPSLKASNNIMEEIKPVVLIADRILPNTYLFKTKKLKSVRKQQ